MADMMPPCILQNAVFPFGKLKTLRRKPNLVKMIEFMQSMN